MSDKKAIMKDFIYYFIDMAFVSIIGYAFYFLMGRLLMPEDYGALMTIVGLATFLTPLLSLGFNEAIVRFIPRISEEESKSLLKYSLKKTLIISFIFSMMFFIFSDFISLKIYSNANLTLPFKLFGLLLMTGVVFMISKGYLQGRKDFKSMLIFDIISQPWRVIVPFFFASIIGGLLGWLICLSIFPIIALFRTFKIKETRSEISEGFLKYGITSAASLAGYYFFIQFPVIFLSLFSFKESGYFAVATVFSQIILFISLVISGLILPHLSTFYKENKLDKVRKLMKISLLQTLLVSSIIFIGLYLFSEKIIGKIYSFKYLASVPYVLGFSFVSIIFGMNWVLLTNMYAKGYPEKRAKYLWISNTVSLILSVILFNYYGVIGIIHSFLFSQIILLAFNVRHLIWQ